MLPSPEIFAATLGCEASARSAPRHPGSSASRGRPAWLRTMAVSGRAGLVWTGVEKYSMPPYRLLSR
jgi:hypothetical protein